MIEGTMNLNRSQLRIMVVDDELSIRQAMVRAISLAGYPVEAASNGPEALSLLERKPFDLMMLDLCMPGMSGVEVMRMARQVNPDLLIIILTGNATLDSAISAVKEGAVDYLRKPASIHNVIATITAALYTRAEQVRRQHLLKLMEEAIAALRSKEASPPPADPNCEKCLQIGALTLNREKRQLIVAGDLPHVINLSEGEAAILANLMEHPDQVVSCGQLARALWGYELDDYSASDLVRPYVFRLRQKVETILTNQQLISTVRGRGYMVASSVPA